MLAGAVPEKKKNRKKRFPGSYSEIKQNSVGPGNKNLATFRKTFREKRAPLNVREKVPIYPNRSCGVHRVSHVRMDDGHHIFGGVSADEYVQGHIACRVLSS
jgi:hypothetical protein